MLLLLICILFNAYISVVFKIFAKYEVRTLQAIVLNYFICALTASVVMGKPAVTLEVVEKPWLWAAIFIGFNFVITFNLFAQTVQRFGVVMGSVFQKMSLIAPTLAAIIIYNESAGWIKILGIILAICSIFLISFSNPDSSDQSDEAQEPKIASWMWVFPIGTFLGSVIVDGGLFYVNQTGLANSNDIDFVATLFFFAGCLGVLFAIYDYFRNGVTFRRKEVIAALGLGIPNFFSIWFLLKVLSNGMDGSVVFPINNVGILFMSAILGLIFFSERFNTRKVLGLAMAIGAIVMIALG